MAISKRRQSRNTSTAGTASPSKNAKRRRRTTWTNIALDGVEALADPLAQHNVLMQFSGYGGDRRALLRTLLDGETARESAMLRREREVSGGPPFTKRDRRRLDNTLHHAAGAASRCRAARDSRSRSHCPYRVE